MRVTVPMRERNRLVRALRTERRQDGLLDLTLVRLDPASDSKIVRQTLPAGDRGIESLTEGGPMLDAREMSGFPPGFWPVRRTAGGWIALIDERLRVAA